MSMSLDKLRSQVNRHLLQFQLGGLSRAKMIRCCYAIVDLQEQIERKLREAGMRRHERRLAASTSKAVEK